MSINILFAITDQALRAFKKNFNLQEDGTYEPNIFADNYERLGNKYYMRMTYGTTKEWIKVYCMGQWGIVLIFSVRSIIVTSLDFGYRLHQQHFDVFGVIIEYFQYLFPRHRGFILFPAVIIG